MLMHNKIVFTVGHVLKFKRKYNEFNFWVGYIWCTCIAIDQVGGYGIIFPHY